MEKDKEYVYCHNEYRFCWKTCKNGVEVEGIWFSITEEKTVEYLRRTLNYLNGLGEAEYRIEFR
jgi:hypothetical protein